ncbi:MAG: hypothetical protein CBCREVIR_2360, partial [Candidatus Burkholderia crenata]
SVTLTQLRFTSFAVVNSQEDLHLQDCAHAARMPCRAKDAESVEKRPQNLAAGSDWCKKQHLIKESSCDRRKRFKRQAMSVRAAICRLR